MNENQLRYSNIRDKTFNIKNKSKYIKTKSHKHKEIFSLVVKECEFIGPAINKIYSIITQGARDCYDKKFHHSKTRCTLDIEMTNCYFVSGIISD